MSDAGFSITPARSDGGGASGPTPAPERGLTVTSGQGPAARVLLVDDDPMQVALLRGILLRDGYLLEAAHDGAAAIQTVTERAPDVVLLDLHMPAADGFSVLEQMQADAWMCRIPVIVITASDDRQDRLRALEMGATDFVSKPVDRDELRARVRSLVRAKRHADDSEQAERVIVALARTAETRDPLLQGRSARLGRLVTTLGQHFGLDPDTERTLRRGANLYDVGMIALPDAVLLKAGPLDEAERAILRTHPVLGDQILRPLQGLDAVRDLVRHHHEHLDGSGYPDALASAQLSVPLRILSVAAAYVALTSARPYRPARPAGEALDTLRAEVAMGWWDPAVLDALARLTLPPGIG